MKRAKTQTKAKVQEKTQAKIKAQTKTKSQNKARLTKEEFLQLLHEAGFKTKKEFAEFMGMHQMSVNNWGTGIEFPHYAKQLMNALINSKRYEDLCKANSLIRENERLKREVLALQEKNKSLEKEMKNLTKKCRDNMMDNFMEFLKKENMGEQ